MTRSLHTFAAAAAAVTLFAGAATAQPEWEVEFVGGFGLTRLAGDDTEITETVDGETVSIDIGSAKVGFTAGGLVTVFLTPRFGVQSGLLWARKGGDGEANIPADVPGVGTVNLSADVTVTLDYVDIPVLGVLDFPVTDGVSVRTMAGPVIGFNTKAEVDVEIAGASESEDIGDEIKSVDVGGLIGAGVVIPLGRVNFHADARYTFGFTKVDDTDADLDLKNAALAIVASIGVPLAR